MKRLFPFLFLVLLVLASCNQDDKEPEFTVTGYWTLKQIVSGLVNTSADGTLIDFDEKYIFNHDGSFIKFSNRPNGMGRKLEVPVQALGTYEFMPVNSFDEELLYELRLEFDTNLGMIANCGEGNVEFLFITRSNQLINTSWAACDGPSFVFSKSR